MNKNVLEVRELNKSFGNVHAVKDLSFRVKRGELFAFLGVNGAGKSTTISILCGQLGKDSGEVQIFNDTTEELLYGIAAHTAGGAFSALAEYVLEGGGVVFGAALDSGLRVSHIAVKNRHDLPQLRGSKPVQSDVGESYQQVRLYLDQGRQVLFSGTPCQVDGLYRYLGEHPERLITCDVACSGVGSPGVWEKFVRSMAYIKQQKPLSVDFRGKLNGESTRRFHVTFENGGQYDAPLLRSEVGRGLARGIFLRPACHTCGYTSTDRTGDLTLCDMTGGAITPEEKRLGVSLLLINTAKGAQMFDSLPLHRRRCGLAEAVAADRALRSPTPVSVDRSRFFDALEQEPFRQVCARFLSALQPREAAGKPLKELLGNVRLPFGKRKQK